MTVSSPSSNLKSYSDIVESDYKVSVMDGTFHYNILKDSQPGTPLAKMFDKATKSEGKLKTSHSPTQISNTLKVFYFLCKERKTFLGLLSYR